MTQPNPSLHERLSQRLAFNDDARINQLAQIGLAEMTEQQEKTHISTLISEHSNVLVDSMLEEYKQSARLARGLRVTRPLRLAWRAALKDLPLNVELEALTDDDNVGLGDEDRMQLVSSVFAGTSYVSGKTKRIEGFRLALTAHRGVYGDISWGYGRAKRPDILKIEHVLIDTATDERVAEPICTISLTDHHENIYSEPTEETDHAFKIASEQIKIACDDGKSGLELHPISVNLAIAMMKKLQSRDIVGLNKIPAGTVTIGGITGGEETHLEALALLLAARSEFGIQENI